MDRTRAGRSPTFGIPTGSRSSCSRMPTCRVSGAEGAPPLGRLRAGYDPTPGKALTVTVPDSPAQSKSAAPVHEDAERRAWIVTGYDAAVEVLRDTRTFSNVNCIGIASFADA